jgi:hypothetical protein
VIVPTGGRRRSLGAITVLMFCTAGVQASSMTATVDPRMLPLTSELAQRLHRHVTTLASPDLQGRKPGTGGNRKAADYIAEQFHAIGLEPLASMPGYRQPLDGGLGDNLIGLRSAAGPTGVAPWILVGAHFDHLGGNYLGADDNASAVGILLETARAMPALAHHHLLFVAFNAEEPPYIRTPLMGSQQFVDRPPPEIGLPTRFQAVIIMDLMGGVHWTPLRDTLFAAGAETSPGLYARLKQASRPEARGSRLEAVSDSPIAPRPLPLAVLPLGMHLIENIPLVGQVSFSDYDAFRNAGVPFLFLSSGRTPRYHQPSDLPDTLHYERMAATVGWLQSLLRAMDDDKEPYRIGKNRVELADDIATLRLLTTLAAREDTEIPGTSFLSRSKMRTDEQWLERLDPGRATADDIKRLQRLSLRMQCLLVDFPACFLL